MMAPHGRGWAHYCVGLLLNVIAFAGLGPIIAYAVFAIAVSLMMPFTLSRPVHLHDLAGIPMMLFSFVVGMVPFGIIAAYVLGAFPAAVTGFFVGLSSSWLGERALRGSGTLLGAVSSALGVVWIFPDLGLVTAAALAGAVAAAVLIRMTRGLRLRPMGLTTKGEVTG